MLNIELSITAGDIARGVRDKAYGCPVSLAISRFMNGMFGTRALTGVTRSISVVTYNDTPVMVRWKHYTDAQEFIDKFDKGEPVAPCDVHVELIDVRSQESSQAIEEEESSLHETEMEPCTVSSKSSGEL